MNKDENVLNSMISEMITKNNQILLNNKKEVGSMNNAKSKVSPFKSMLVMVLIVAMSLCFFAGCGGTSVLGTWKLDRVVNDGKTIKSNDADKGEFAEDFNNVLIFNEDKTGSFKIRADSATDGSWKQTNNAITVTSNSNDTTFTLSGAELIYDNEGVRYFYKKSA